MGKPFLTLVLSLLIVLFCAERSFSDELDKIVEQCQKGDFSNVKTKLIPLAESGNARAQFNLGVSYFHGNGVEKDYDKAFYWSKKAAEQGNVRAEMNLGNHYYKGIGTEISYPKARALFEKSANKGNPFAQVTLGDMYKNGLGGDVDLAKAYECYDSAARKGLMVAGYNKAVMLLEGQGVGQDVVQAVLILNNLGEANFYPAQMQLARIYEVEKYGRQNKQEALRWKQAAANNQRNFMAGKDGFGKRKSADDIKRSQIKAQDLDSEVERKALNDLSTASE